MHRVQFMTICILKSVILVSGRMHRSINRNIENKEISFSADYQPQLALALIAPDYDNELTAPSVFLL